MKMDECAFPVPARELELCQAQQSIFSLRSERIIDHYVLVVAFRIRRI